MSLSQLTAPEKVKNTRAAADDRLRPAF